MSNVDSQSCTVDQHVNWLTRREPTHTDFTEVL
jgi:hypothetical protein